MKRLFFLAFMAVNVYSQCLPHYVCNSTVVDFELFNDTANGTMLTRLDKGIYNYTNSVGITGTPSSVTAVSEGAVSGAVEILPSIIYLSANNAYFNFDSSGVIRCTDLHNSSMPNGDATEQDIRSGTYTPTVTGILNLSSITATQAQWIRVGNVVTVSGRFTADPVAGTNTSFSMTLPIPSNLGNKYDCGGTSFCGTVSQGAEVTGDTALDQALFFWKASHSTLHTWSYTFTYTIF